MNLRALLYGPAVRLRYVTRYSTCRVSHPESVAEHCFFVALYADAIASWIGLCNPGIKIDRAVLLRKALWHDIEEASTGDMPRSFKHSNEEVRKALEHSASGAVYAIADETFANLVIAREIQQLWKKSKDKTIEGRIVAFADFLSCLSYLSQESLDHNDLILEHCNTMEEYAGSFLHKDFEFLGNLALKASGLVKILFKKGVCSDGEEA